MAGNADGGTDGGRYRWREGVGGGVNGGRCGGRWEWREGWMEV